MTTINKYKEELCNKYNKVLEIIGILNKGFILQKQLIEIMILIEISENEYQARKIINILLDGQIIKKINFMDTKNKIIILKKYGIRYLAGKSKNGSGSVSSIRTCTTNQRYFRSILLNHKIIYILSNESNRNSAIKNGLVNFLNMIGANITRDNLSFYKYYLSVLDRIDKSSLQRHIDILEKEKKQKEDAYTKSSLNRTYRTGAVTHGLKNRRIALKKSAFEKRQEMFYYSTLETLKRKDCYLLFLSNNNSSNNLWHFIFLDTLDQQNVKKIIENIALIYNIVRDLSTIEFRIRIEVLTWNEESSKYIKDNIDRNLTEILSRNYRIWSDCIEVFVRDVNMTENYLGNIRKISY